MVLCSCVLWLHLKCRYSNFIFFTSWWFRWYGVGVGRDKGRMERKEGNRDSTVPAITLHATTLTKNYSHQRYQFPKQNQLKYIFRQYLYKCHLLSKEKTDLIIVPKFKGSSQTKYKSDIHYQFSLATEIVKHRKQRYFL